MAPRLLMMLSVAVAVFVGSTRTHAQQRYGENVQVTVVEIPVTVVDRAGNPIRGLTRSDFEIFDEGKRVEIEYFEMVDLGASRGATPDKPLPPAAYRNFLLLFDLANSSPTSIGRAKEAALEFVQGQLSGVDLAAVAVYTNNEGIHLLTNFTGDRALLRQAITSMGMSAEFKLADPLMLTSIHDSSAMEAARPDTGRGPGVRAGIIGDEKEVREHWNRMTQASNEKEKLGRIQAQIASFGSVALALDRLRGQKQIILLSEGFAGHLLTGRERLGFKATNKENDAVASGELWKVDSEKRFGSLSGTSEITQMAELFKRSDVRMHAIDIRGIRTDSDVAQTSVDVAESLSAGSNEGLSLVSRPTGGTVFRNSNDLAANFQKLLRQQEVIYLLGFRSRGTSPGRFHNIRVKSGARSAHLTHRSGYFEPSAFANDMERVVGLAEIMVKDIDVADVPLSLLTAAVPGGDDTARVLVVVEVPGGRLIEVTAGGVVTADLLVYAFDENRRVRDFMQQRLELDLAKTGDALLASGIRYIGALRLKPGNYDVKALVRIGENGRTGSTRSRLTVPAFDAGSILPPLAVAEKTQWINILSPQRGREIAAVLSSGGLPMVPSVRAELTAGSEQRIALLLHRVSDVDLKVTPSIVAANGSTSAAIVSLIGRTEADAEGVSKLLFNFKPEGLTAGDYNLRFTVTPKDGASAVVSLPFVVQ